MEYSEKFKNRASGIKESLNLSKILGGLTAKSNNYKLQNDSFNVRGNKKNKKNPQISTVGPNQSGKLKSGDSSADILAKMYNFMEKNYQDEVKKYEIEKAFHQEQIDEDKKRHKKLIEGLTSKEEEKIEEPKKGESWIEKMLSGMKSALGILLSPVKLLFSLFSVIGDIFSPLKTLFLSLTSIITSLVMDILGGPSNLIGKMLLKFFTGSSFLLKQVLAAIFGFLPPQLKVVAALAGFAWAKGEEEHLANEMMYGKKGAEKYEYFTEKEKPVIDRTIFQEEEKLKKMNVPPRPSDPLRAQVWDSKYAKSFDPMTGEPLTETLKNLKEQQKKRIEEAKAAKDRMVKIVNDAIISDFYDIEPSLNAVGFEREGVSEVDDDGIIYWKLKNKYTGTKIQTNDPIQMQIARSSVPALKKIDENVIKPIEGITNEINSRIVQPAKNYLTDNVIPELKDAESYIKEKENPSVIIQGKVNNIGNLKDEIKQLQPSRARDDDSTIIKVITNSIISV